MAGVGHLHAVGLLERRPAAVQRLHEVPFPVAKDLGGDYSLAVTDQRHRAVFNGIWQVGGGFQLSGMYFYGSGERCPSVFTEKTCAASARGSRRSRSACAPTARIVPRNGFVGDPVHRVDIRLQERIPLGGRVGDRRHPGGVQPVQSRQLRLVRDRRAEPALRRAGVQLESRVRAADGAVGVQADVLTHLHAGWDGFPAGVTPAQKYGWHLCE